MKSLPLILAIFATLSLSAQVASVTSSEERSLNQCPITTWQAIDFLEKNHPNLLKFNVPVETVFDTVYETKIKRDTVTIVERDTIRETKTDSVLVTVADPVKVYTTMPVVHDTLYLTKIVYEKQIVPSTFDRTLRRVLSGAAIFLGLIALLWYLKERYDGRKNHTGI